MTSPSTPAAGPRPKRSARAVFCSAHLTLEVIVVLLAALVAYGLREPGTSTGPIWIVAGVGALLCVIAAGLVRKPAGIWFGSAVQVGLIASGFVVSMMFVVGALFAALWVVAVLLGNRIDAERAERSALEDRLSS